jgi:hypothetical protein
MRAVTRPLGRDVDLNGFAAGDGLLFVRDGVGLAGRGVAARVPLEAVPDVLADIERDDEVGHPGCGPVALGVMPFRPCAPAELLIPTVTIGKGADGTRWITTVEGGDGPGPGDVDLEPCPPPVASAGGFRVEPGVPVETYLAAVTAGRDQVRAGRLTKVVIARDVVVTADRPLDVHAVLLRLRAAFGSSYRYSIEGFVGASPELLVARHGDVVRSHPLAGTAPRTGDPTNDARLAAALITSTKDQVEHRVVIDVVHETLLPWCSYLDWEEEPSIVAVANVQHLGTLIEGRLSSPAPNVLELAQALSRASSAVATAAPSAGSTGPATGRGRSPSAARRSTGRRPGCSRAAASWRTASRWPSWPRPRPSCRRCSRPSSGRRATSGY